MLVDSQRYVASNSFLIELCCFQSIVNSFPGTCIYCSVGSINSKIIKTVLISNQNTGNSEGTIYLSCLNSQLSNLHFCNCTNALSSAFSISVTNYSFTTCVSCIDCKARDYYTGYSLQNENLKSCNFSRNQASQDSAFRIGYSSRSAFMYVNGTYSNSGATIEITDSILSYLNVVYNDFGSPYGLFRVSYTNSELEYTSIFYNYGVNLVTSYGASIKVTNCITDQPQTEFSYCYDYSGCLFSQQKYSRHSTNIAKCDSFTEGLEASFSYFPKNRVFLPFFFYYLG